MGLENTSMPFNAHRAISSLDELLNNLAKFENIQANSW
jgi:hypothetical protein